MTFKEWLATLTPHRKHTPAEDLADSIGLAMIVGLLMLVVFL